MEAWRDRERTHGAGQERRNGTWSAVYTTLKEFRIRTQLTNL